MHRNANTGIGKKQRAFTLIDLLIATVIFAILAVVAQAAYASYIERVRIARAIADIGEIQIAVAKYLATENAGYPASLAELGLDSMIDPWGNPYQYLVIEGLGNNGPVRKNERMVPINTDYDIYSMGKDGASESPLTSRLSRDDIVRGGNGTYLGLASDY